MARNEHGVAFAQHHEIPADSAQRSAFNELGAMLAHKMFRSADAIWHNAGRPVGQQPAVRERGGFRFRHQRELL
jgi:hypothetical protein